MLAAKRLLRELHDNAENDGDGEVLALQPVADDSLFAWTALIRSTEPHSPFADSGGRFKLAIAVPDDYPLSPPSIKFTTKVCHPNVHWETGEICLDLLKAQWSPAWTLKSACVAISLLLDAPEPDSPLNCDAANLLRCNDLRGYNSLVRMYIGLYGEEGRGVAK